MRAKNLKDYCKGTMYFTDYQYCLILLKIYIEKSLFWYIEWQIMNICNFKNLVSHRNIFFQEKMHVYVSKVKFLKPRILSFDVWIHLCGFNFQIH